LANALAGLKQAAKQNLKTIGLTGKDRGAIAKCVDLLITVACANTARIQECYVTIGHILCELVETELVHNGKDV